MIMIPQDGEQGGKVIRRERNRKNMCTHGPLLQVSSGAKSTDYDGN